MKKNIKINLILLLLLQAFVLHCSDPVSPIPELDPELIGDWYKVDTLYVGSSSKIINFHGIQITDDKKFKLLGIETNTGKVAVMQDSFKKIQKANQGKLTFEYNIEGSKVLETTNYRIENNKLILSDNNQNTVYKKTKLDYQLLEPINSNLSVKIDTESYENNKISRNPSAYVFRASDTELGLNAEMDHTYLTIKVNDFIGTGIYEISFNEGEIAIFRGDVGEIFISDSVITGTITINEYDEINNICSGTFSFNAVALYENTFIKEVREGIFSIPIYR